MGADFIAGFVPVSRVRDEAIQKLYALSDEQIESAIYGTNLDIESNDEGTYWIFPDDGEPQINRATLIPQLEKYVNIVYDTIEGKYRTTTWFHHDDLVIAGTGGLSWGDTPDLVDEISIVYSLGVTYDPTMKLTWVKKDES